MTNNVKIKRTFHATAERVFDAWTKPELLTKWMGPGSVTCVKFECDLRIGGKYEIHMQTDEGVVVAYGEYQEIETNKKLSFTWSWQHIDVKDSLVTISFIEAGQNTEILLEHTRLPDKEIADRHHQGWEGGIVKLEQLLDTLT